MLLTETRRRHTRSRATESRAADRAAEGGFVRWYRGRPALGGLLTILAGVEIFLSSQLDLGNIRVQLGIEGMQATVIPIALVLVGVLAMLMPAHHIFYGVIGLAVSVYAVIGVNLGGFVLGTLLGCVGGILVVAWMPRPAPVEDTDAGRAERTGTERTGTDA
ncbi:DUF6114 domain-containing protein [Microbacterium sp.]|uniref:DUF6114 domain-containing protein n=1 Tax=Microbacterium sp. TaxID=51671 RepID=UPI003A9132B3